MNKLKLLTEKEKKEFIAIEDFNFHKQENPWKCYACGNEIGFHTVSIWTDYGYEYDCVCDKCGSDHTFPNGEGEPLHECGECGWDCWKCNMFCCEECWEWKPKREEGEEKDYICNECLGQEV